MSSPVSFSASASPDLSSRLAALRAVLASQGLHGFIVPRADEFLGEYVPACAERLSWLTGFTGSAGVAVILADKAVVMSDGRYTEQLAAEVDAALYEVSDSIGTGMSSWLAQAAAPDAVIGYDPRLHTVREIAALAKTLRGRGVSLRPCEANPVDQVWRDRPLPPSTTVEIFPEAFAGQSACAKYEAIAARLRDTGALAAILAKPDSVAWLLNIRGRDVPHTPFALSSAIIRADGAVDWFIDPARLDADVRKHIGPAVRVHSPVEHAAVLSALALESQVGQSPVVMDYLRTPVWYKTVLERAGATVEDQEDPCLLPRACKTAAEQDAMRAVHKRDAVAVIRCLKWLDEDAPKGTLTELAVVDKLESLRRRDPAFQDSSFDTIAGWAGHGAIVHYRPTPDSNATIVPPGLLLLDSGGQYADGTTDITRTIAIGTPTAEMRYHNTLVLKGHIAVATALFPEGVNGAALDDRARRPLYDARLDFDHGTGHGVGVYLSVHEDSASISKRGDRPFKPGMILSNEPGFYRRGAYGIRIENLLLVREDGVRDFTDGKIRMLSFETLTLVPFDARLIDRALLDEAERAWLNAYHKRVYEEVAPLLDADERDWLAAATAPL